MVEDWLRNSSTIVLLSVESEEELLSWQRVCASRGVPHVLVREPDIDDEATALAVPPSEMGPLFADLPLQGKAVSVMV